MFATVIERFGRLNIHVNNAGVQTWKRLLDVTEEEWDLVIDTNLKGCFLCTQAAARHMKDQGGGAIVNIGSGCNKLAFPDLVAYTASKGGIEMFTKVAAVELGPHGIRVNCVAPGAVEVERTKLEDPDYAGTWGRITPLGRVGTPADIGRAVTYMVSPARRVRHRPDDLGRRRHVRPSALGLQTVLGPAPTYLIASPHGLPPVAIRRSTVPVARSTIDTSADGPFAV